MNTTDYEKIYSDSLSAVDSVFANAPGKEVLIKALRYCSSIGVIYPETIILDIGCGTGHFLNRIHDEVSESWTLYGIDSSSKAIEIGKQRYININFIKGSISRELVKSESIDIIVSYGSIEHISRIDRLLENFDMIYSALKSNGLFFIMIPTLGVQRADRDDEGWYEEFRIDKFNMPLQLQWNLKRNTWESYFYETGLTLCPHSIAQSFGALKPGNFYFGCKRTK